MAKTTIRCPKCGAAFEIPAKTLLGVIGNVLGEDSNLGDCYLKTKDDEPKKPLRDSSGKFVSNSLHGIDLAGEEYGKEVKYGCENAVDSITEDIRKQGYVKNHRLFRRWIMAQLFHMLSYQDKYQEKFSDLVRNRGVRYMFKVIENETKDMEAIKRNGDLDEFERRYRWWNPSTLNKIFYEYFNLVKDQTEKLKVHKCKGRPYVDIPGWGMVFTDELDKKVWSKIQADLSLLNSDNMFRAVPRICGSLGRFKDSSRWKVRMPATFINAFKGNGAYFTLRNMVMFHGCFLSTRGKAPVETQLAELDRLAEQYKNEGWQLLGLVKDTLKANHMNVDKKIAEWRDKRRA